MLGVCCFQFIANLPIPGTVYITTSPYSGHLPYLLAKATLATSSFHSQDSNAYLLPPLRNLRVVSTDKERTPWAGVDPQSIWPKESCHFSSRLWTLEEKRLKGTGRWICQPFSYLHAPQPPLAQGGSETEKFHMAAVMIPLQEWATKLYLLQNLATSVMHSLVYLISLLPLTDAPFPSLLIPWNCTFQ